jgi:hypothetical protein
MFCGDRGSSLAPYACPACDWFAGDVVENTDGGVVDDCWNRLAMGVSELLSLDMKGTEPGVVAGSIVRICWSCRQPTPPHATHRTLDLVLPARESLHALLERVDTRLRLARPVLVLATAGLAPLRLLKHALDAVEQAAATRACAAGVRLTPVLALAACDART